MLSAPLQPKVNILARRFPPLIGKLLLAQRVHISFRKDDFVAVARNVAGEPRALNITIAAHN